MLIYRDKVVLQHAMQYELRSDLSLLHLVRWTSLAPTSCLTIASKAHAHSVVFPSTAFRILDLSTASFYSAFCVLPYRRAR